MFSANLWTNTLKIYAKFRWYFKKTYLCNMKKYFYSFWKTLRWLIGSSLALWFTGCSLLLGFWSIGNLVDCILLLEIWITGLLDFCISKFLALFLLFCYSCLCDSWLCCYSEWNIVFKGKDVTVMIDVLLEKR